MNNEETHEANNPTYETLDEVIEQIDAELVDQTRDVESTLIDFSKFIAVLTDDAYAAKDIAKLRTLISNAKNKAYELKVAVKDIKTKCAAMELAASIKRSPLNTDKGDEDEDYD
jgi:5'-deoxynucleotidase YfbR-like HD superfamily hydrolase